MSERKRQAASFILGILFGGALVGAGTHFYFSRCMTLACHHQPPQKQPFLLELRGRLNLTADQEKKIGEIIESKRKKIEAMRGDIRPEMKKLREESRDKIRKVLTAEQQPIFEQIVAERMKRWEDKAGPEKK